MREFVSSGQSSVYVSGIYHRVCNDQVEFLDGVHLFCKLCKRTGGIERHAFFSCKGVTKHISHGHGLRNLADRLAVRNSCVFCPGSLKDP